MFAAVDKRDEQLLRRFASCDAACAGLHAGFCRPVSNMYSSILQANLRHRGTKAPTSQTVVFQKKYEL